MNNDTPGRRLIAAIKARVTRAHIEWLKWELRAADLDINATTAEIADYVFCGQHHTADGLRVYLRQRTAEAAGLCNRIHQLKESLQ